MVWTSGLKLIAAVTIRVKASCGVLLLLTFALHGSEAAVPATPESPQFSVTAADCDATMTADITVSWEYPPTTSEANVTTSLDGSPVAIGGTDEFPLISGVTLDTEHNVTIIASNSDGASDPVTLTFTLETQVPYPPMDLTLELGCGEPIGPITATWINPALNNDLLCPVNSVANVEYTVNGGSPTTSSPQPGTTDTILVSSSVLSGTVYQVGVSLENAVGRSIEASASVPIYRITSIDFSREESCIQVMLNSQCAQPETFRALVRYGPGDNFTAFQSSSMSFNSSYQVCLPINNLDSGTLSYAVFIFQGSSSQSVDDSQVTTESLGCSRDGLTNNPHVRVNPDLANYNVGQRITYSCDESTRSRSGPRTRTCQATGEWDPPLSNDTSCPVAVWVIVVVVIGAIICIAILIAICCCICCIKTSVEAACCCPRYTWKGIKWMYKFCKCWIVCFCGCCTKACEDDEEEGAGETSRLREL